MGAATTLSTPQDQVEALIHQVAEENALDISDQLADLNPASASLREGASVQPDKEDQLSRRLEHVDYITICSKTCLNDHLSKSGNCQL